MRILLIAPHSFYIDRGSPIDIDILARALTRRGDVVDLVVYRDGEDRDYPRLTIHRAKMPAWLGPVGPGFSWRKLVADLWLFSKASELVSRNHYDVVHASEEAVFLAMWYRFRRRLPYVYDMDSSIAQQLVEKKSWLKPMAPFFGWCETRAIRGALAAAPVCNALADLARARGGRYVATLHDISQLTAESFEPRESIRERLGLRGTILMYVGNLEVYQGIDLLLESLPMALAQHADLALVIAGGNPDAIERYRAKARRLGVDGQTHFIGNWPAQRLGELLAQADILAAPRIKGINTPMKIFPYLHSGRAVLVTDLPTHTQILDGSVCELAPANPAGFAGAIARLASDPERRKKLGEAGRLFVERNHTFAAHERRVNELYDHVASELGNP